jgi:SUMO ligase MMS21 Smc5/6 complex component
MLVEDGDESDSDDEVAVGGATQSYNCPITLKLLEDPVISCVIPLD